MPCLVEHFLERLAVRMNRGRLTMSPGAMARLQSYHWPGNVRQLEHLLEQMIALGGKDAFDEEDIPQLPLAKEPDRLVSVSLENAGRVDMDSVLNEVEARLVRWALGRAGGNLARASELLGIPRSTLQYKVAKLADKGLCMPEADGPPSAASYDI